MFDNAMLSGFEIYPRWVPLSYRREPHTHSTEGFDDSLETCEIERCSVSEPVFKHNHCAPAFTTKMWSWVVL